MPNNQNNGGNNQNFNNNGNQNFNNNNGQNFNNGQNNNGQNNNGQNNMQNGQQMGPNGQMMGQNGQMMGPNGMPMDPSQMMPPEPPNMASGLTMTVKALWELLQLAGVSFDGVNYAYLSLRWFMLESWIEFYHAGKIPEEYYKKGQPYHGRRRPTEEEAFKRQKRARGYRFPGVRGEIGSIGTIW